MTQVTKADQVLLLLRAHLDRTQKSRSRRTGSGAPRDRVKAVERARLIAESGAQDGDVQRALLAAILTDEFGEEVVNDPRFQGMIDDIFRIIQADPGGADLLRHAVRQLAAPG